MSKKLQQAGEAKFWQFVLGLFVWLVLVLLATTRFDLGRRESPYQHVDKRRYAEQIALLEQVEDSYRAHRYPAGLRLLESRHTLFDGGQVAPQLRVAYYLLAGKLHWSLWQYVEADQAWHEAQKYAHSEQQRRMLATLVRDSQRVLSDVNRERDSREVYLASPDIGPAAVLRGRVALIYIFLVDGQASGWSLRDRAYALDTWRLARDWLSHEARGYGVQLSFSQRVFLVDKNPHILRLRVGELSNKFRNVETVATLVARQLGYPGLLALSEDIRRQEHADQAMVILHLDRDGRSFASRCMSRCGHDGEFAVLLEAARRKKWQSLQYAQAHESLHLFGADDLYNIRGAKYFEVRDIMNYPSSVLQASSLEPLTAWSVGLKARRPQAPFRIKTFHPAEESWK